MPVTPVTLSYPALACHADFTVEWEYLADDAITWTASGVTTNTIAVNSFYQNDNTMLRWRLKMTNTQCNTISYSNVVDVAQYICRYNSSPVLYPNPSIAGQIVTIRSSDTPHKISLMTIDGKRLETKIISNVRGFIRIQVPSTLPSGTYILEIRNPQGYWAEKLLIKNI